LLKSLQAAPDLRRILDQVLDALAGKVVVVHYKTIERQFMDAALQLRIGEGIEFPVVDTLALEYEIERQKHSGFWNRLRGRRLTLLPMQLLPQSYCKPK